MRVCLYETFWVEISDRLFARYIVNSRLTLSKLANWARSSMSSICFWYRDPSPMALCVSRSNSRGFSLANSATRSWGMNCTAETVTCRLRRHLSLDWSVRMFLLDGFSMTKVLVKLRAWRTGSNCRHKESHSDDLCSYHNVPWLCGLAVFLQIFSLTANFPLNTEICMQSTILFPNRHLPCNKFSFTQLSLNHVILYIIRKCCMRWPLLWHGNRRRSLARW